MRGQSPREPGTDGFLPLLLEVEGLLRADPDQGGLESARAKLTWIARNAPGDAGNLAMQLISVVNHINHLGRTRDSAAELAIAIARLRAELESPTLRPVKW